MGQVLHGCATTTHAVPNCDTAIEGSAQGLAARHGLNHKTVAKWRNAPTAENAALDSAVV